MSPGGCRNGDQCKFSHESPAAAAAASAAEVGSVVSSEESEGEIREEKQPPPCQPAPIIKQEEVKDDHDVPLINTEEKNNIDHHVGEEEKLLHRESSPEEANPLVSPFRYADLDSDHPPYHDRHTGPPSNKKESDRERNRQGSETERKNKSTGKKKKRNRRGMSDTDSPFVNPKKKTKTTIPLTFSPQQKGKLTKRDSVDSDTVDFRSLSLPVASMSTTTKTKSEEYRTVGRACDEGNHDDKDHEEEDDEEDDHDDNDNSDTPFKPAKALLPLPQSTEAGRKWLDLVKRTRKHAQYDRSYDFCRYQETDDDVVGGKGTWVKAKRFGSWCAGNPAAIAVDCEMCETEDPVSGQRDSKALCRVSVIDAETGEVLLDSLVKPAWPVVDYRTWINGIAAEHLENVQFTLRHAQAFLMAVCSEETAILGHAVHNDLVALRMEHHCVADSACLFMAADSPTATVSLRDLASAILNEEMPEVHDSVKDAKVALACLNHYRERGGHVDPIPRTYALQKQLSRERFEAISKELLVHRIPKGRHCREAHISLMFLQHTGIQPDEVKPIEFPLTGAGTTGKTHVVFRSRRHAELAFDTLEDKKPDVDRSGRSQKKVYLRTGKHICVRKMIFETNQLHHHHDNNNKDHHQNGLGTHKTSNDAAS